MRLLLTTLDPVKRLSTESNYYSVFYNDRRGLGFLDGEDTRGAGQGWLLTALNIHMKGIMARLACRSSFCRVREQVQK